MVERVATAVPAGAPRWSQETAATAATAATAVSPASEARVARAAKEGPAAWAVQAAFQASPAPTVLKASLQGVAAAPAAGAAEADLA
jgi:hypothetical protein